MRTLRTAILGCGGWGNRHAQNLVKLPEMIELVAFCDVDLGRASTCAKTFAPNASIFNDYHEMLKRIPMDLLIIALPPFAHSDEVQACAERGIHILIEKPIALTHQHAWQMVEAAEKARICTQVGFMYRFGAAVQRLKELIDTGVAGGVGLLRAGYYCNHLHNPWWIDKTKSGGQVMEQAIHLVDLMRYFGGEVEAVFSKQHNLFHQDVPGYTVEDVSGTVFTFKNGAIGVLAASNAAVPWKWTWDFKVIAKNLVADYSDSNHARFTFTNVHNPQPNTIFPQEDINADQDDYMHELLDLLQAIETGSSTRTPIREGALTLDVVVAADESARTGEAVSVS